MKVASGMQAILWFGWKPYKFTPTCTNYEACVGLIYSAEIARALAQGLIACCNRTDEYDIVILLDCQLTKA